MERNISMCKSVLYKFDKLKFNIWMLFTASKLSFLPPNHSPPLPNFFLEILTSDWCSSVKFNKSLKSYLSFIWWHLLYKLSLSDAERCYSYLCLHDWLYCCQLDLVCHVKNEAEINKVSAAFSDSLHLCVDLQWIDINNVCDTIVIL